MLLPFCQMLKARVFQLQRPVYFDVQKADASEYVKAGKAAGRALFFSWPLGTMRCLEHYNGDTVFWIGEDCTDNVECAYEGAERDWMEVHTMQIPQWSLVYDKFVVYKRRAKRALGTSSQKNVGDDCLVEGTPSESH